MVSAPSLTDHIAELKSSRRAFVLAHHYQDPEIQEVADEVGDTLELMRAAQLSPGDVIVLCGAKFMAETAKVLNPNKTVVVPDLRAGCSLVDSCPVAGLQAFKRRYPGTVIVSYINTSIEVKAESDFICSSANAVAVVNSIPTEKSVLFLPDINLGNWVKNQTGRKNMQIWQGACIVHATFSSRRLHGAVVEHPEALVAAHPGCPSDILRLADFIGSTSQIIDWCTCQKAREFILLTESGVRFSLERDLPNKKFYFIQNENCNCSECPYMRLNSLEKLLACLETLTPSIEIEANVMSRARRPIERMLETS